MTNETRQFIKAAIIGVLPVILCLTLSLSITIVPRLTRLVSATNTQEAVIGELEENIALRLTINADWEDIKQHIYCVITKTGRTRAQVEADLLMVDTYEILDESSLQVPPGITLYRFDEISWVIRGVYVRYEADQVAEVTIREGGGSWEASQDREFDCADRMTPTKQAMMLHERSIETRGFAQPLGRPTRLAGDGVPLRFTPRLKPTLGR